VLDPESGTVRELPRLFSNWGRLYQLLSYDESNNSILMIAQVDYNNGLFSYNLELEKLTRLTDVSYRFEQASLSPNNKLLGVVENYSSSNRRLRIIDLETYQENTYLVPGGSISQNTGPAIWSADSQSALMTTSGSSGRTHIVLYDLLDE